VDLALVGAHYRIEHPRLPHPDAAYLRKLREDPKRLAHLRRRRHDFPYTNLFLAYLATRDPELLREIEDLADAPLKGMWFHQVDVLAVAYDWFYDDLSPAVRSRFLARLVHQTENAQKYYRDLRISPYNDVGYIRLHTAPFVGALVVYPDSTHGAELVRFARHVLFDVYLPVWRQIMDGGGWNEGITYLRKGVGNVIVPLLASWGYATRVDLLGQNRWVSELVRYPIHTTRPDYTSLRLGDDNTPELIIFEGMESLARVFDDPVGLWWATRGHGIRHPEKPAAWPWWPPDAADDRISPPTSLPPHHYFKGIGLVTMRSDWSEGATFASFRVGDHFWSHQHFDSGAFTIYHRGALAIDSGTYKAGYNSRHHLKYAMQTIAHNCITVSDPADHYSSNTAPVLRWCARLLGGAQGHFAGLCTKLVRVAGLLDRHDLPNDGGERRVGSGGYNISPDDLAHWQAERDDYEMGDMVTVAMHPGFVYCKGDVTAAFTNSKSRSHLPDYRARTRRVRRWLRDFLYLRPDLFVVLDRVASYDATFTKRWLLHTIDRPEIEPGHIAITRAERVRSHYAWDSRLHHISGKRRRWYQYDGRLDLYPLLPKGALVRTVGGPGHEFDIEGVSYNEDNRGHPVVPSPTRGADEPGAWRVEIMPPEQHLQDLFLNVLVTSDADQPAERTVRRVAVEAGDLVGAEVGWEGQAVCALFASRLDDQPVDGAIAYPLGDHPKGSTNLLMGLAPGMRYRLSVADVPGGLRVRLDPGGAAGEGLVVDAQGVLRFGLPGYSAGGAGRKGRGTEVQGE